MKFEKEWTKERKHYKSEEKHNKDVKREKEKHKHEHIYYATSGVEKIREEERSLQTKQQFERKG